MPGICCGILMVGKLFLFGLSYYIYASCIVHHDLSSSTHLGLYSTQKSPSFYWILLSSFSSFSCSFYFIYIQVSFKLYIELDLLDGLCMCENHAHLTSILTFISVMKTKYVMVRRRICLPEKPGIVLFITIHRIQRSSCNLVNNPE
jgi:hypothetical protein